MCIYSFLLPGSPASCASIRLPVVLLTSLLGLLGLHLLTILLYLATTILSSLGSLIRPKPRAKVVVVAYILILVSAVELGWLVLSTYSAVDAYIGLNATVTLGSGGGSGGLTVRLGSGDLDISGGGSGNGISDDDSICSPYESAVLAFSLLVIAAWVVYSMILLGLIIFLDPCGCCLGSALVQRIARTQKYHSKDYNDKSLADFDKFDSIQGLHGNDLEYSLLCAKLRETFCSCCRRDGLKSSRKDALSDVVQVLRILFSDVDTTFSDLLAGFLLASLYQQNLMAANKCTDHELTKVCIDIWDFC